ncbi:spore gernimation protein GerC [Geobacillus subterraneus]|uniref:Spore gernimation protein GerC n=2 Tax=Geobacillus TaxID=129337 RepID=A0ABM6ABM8_9BACL|nr:MULTISPECIES: Ger(x)C family spore germination protein [Geobacillus]AMX83694.1 spore gernimation protein GerC [Geobacillus subterraneus]KZS26422.1 spore gernimation protein GerC [Geobacillus subterraneus]OXB87908.1 spore gernimation protein GerC [Geobacillus uzenensis]
MRKQVIPIIASIMLLGGCWDTRNIDHIVYIHSIGVDYKDGQVIAYVQLVGFTALAKVEAGGDKEKAAVSIGKALGETFNIATDKIYPSIQQRVSWGHVKSIVFTKRALQKDIVADVIDVLNRYNEIRHTAWVYATDEPLSDLFETTPLLNASSYYSLLSNPEEIFQQSSFIRPIRLSRLIAAMDEKADTARLPYLTIEDNRWAENKKPKQMLAISGVCFLHDYRLQGCERRSDLQGLRWIERDIRRTPIYVKQKGKTVASLIVHDPKTKWSVGVKDGEPAFTINVEAQGSLLELREPLSRKQLTKLAEQTVKQEIHRLYELGKERQIDILNLAEQLYRERPNLWKKHQTDGLIPLNNHTLSVNVKLVISASGKEKLNFRAGD